MTILSLRRGGSQAPSRRTENQGNSISRIDPWNDLNQMDRIFDNFFRSPFYLVDPRSQAAQNGGEQHQIELYENEDELVAYLFAPGLDTASLDISATADQITVRGERKPQFTPKEGTVSHTPWAGSALASSAVSASYSLPVEIDPENITASYTDGVLEIKMTKHETTKPKQVKVQLNNGNGSQQLS